MTLTIGPGAVRYAEGTQQCYCTRFLPGLHSADEVCCTSCGASFQRSGAEW